MTRNHEDLKAKIYAALEVVIPESPDRSTAKEWKGEGSALLQPGVRQASDSPVLPHLVFRCQNTTL